MALIRNLLVLSMSLSSPVIQHHQSIPSRYTCQGEDISPPLFISHVPEKTKCFVLIVDDPDAPGGTWDHWVIWNIPVTNEIQEGHPPQEAVQGKNSWGTRNYRGPCPPSGTHRYFFKLYAIDTELDLPKTSTKKDVEKAMKEHILDQSELIGTYKKS